MDTSHANKDDELNVIYCEIIAKGIPHGRESDIVRLFMQTTKIVGALDDAIPMTIFDTVVCEMAFKFGRADIVIFHVDGSASVIEVKDGNKGYNHVVAGIGQAALYAAQLGMNRGALTKVRKCLLWTSIGDVSADLMVALACEASNTVPMPWGKLGVHLAWEQAVTQHVMTKRRNDG